MEHTPLVRWINRAIYPWWDIPSVSVESNNRWSQMATPSNENIIHNGRRTCTVGIECSRRTAKEIAAWTEWCWTEPNNITNDIDKLNSLRMFSRSCRIFSTLLFLNKTLEFRKPNRARMDNLKLVFRRVSFFSSVGSCLDLLKRWLSCCVFRVQWSTVITFFFWHLRYNNKVYYFAPNISNTI